MIHLLSIAIPLLAGPPGFVGDAAAPAAQDRDAVRILRRDVRIMPRQGGGLDVREIVAILAPEASGADPSETVPPIPLIWLGPAEDLVVPFAGGSSKLRRVDDQLVIREGVPADTTEISFVYRLPPGIEEVVLRAPVPTDTLRVYVPRGSMRVDAGPGFVSAGRVGYASSPYGLYVAGGLMPDSAVSLALVRDAVDWRQRIAVLVATALAAGVVAWGALARDRAPGRRMGGPGPGSGD